MHCSDIPGIHLVICYYWPLRGFRSTVFGIGNVVGYRSEISLKRRILTFWAVGIRRIVLVGRGSGKALEESSAYYPRSNMPDGVSLQQMRQFCEPGSHRHGGQNQEQNEHDQLDRGKLFRVR